MGPEPDGPNGFKFPTSGPFEWPSPRQEVDLAPVRRAPQLRRPVWGEWVSGFVVPTDRFRNLDVTQPGVNIAFKPQPSWWLVVEVQSNDIVVPDTWLQDTPTAMVPILFRRGNVVYCGDREGAADYLDSTKFD